MDSGTKVSILILTHNAPRFIYKTLKSLRMTQDVSYEVIVVDNRSNFLTSLAVLWMFRKGWIDKLWYSSYNSLFAEGNNIASRFAAEDATHYLLLNSDVEIRRSDWLRILLKNHEYGITSYGVVTKPPVPRVDGYCLLIDSDLYKRHGLDESFAWYWAVTGLQAKVLTEGLSVKGYAKHEDYLHHFWHKSGKTPKKAKGMKTDPKEVVSWFQGRAVTLLERPHDIDLPHRHLRGLPQRPSQVQLSHQDTSDIVR